MTLSKRLLAKLFVCLLVLSTLAPKGAQAQIRSGDSSLLPGTTSQNPLSQLRERLAGSSTVPLPLEGAVDPERYLVGPGDLFDVAISGPSPLVTSVPVSADGRLLLPDAGSVRVAGLTLAEARQRILQQLSIQFRNVATEVTLAQPRQFYVHLSGAVPVPGRYLATPVARVSTVLELAYADTSQIAVTNPNYRPSLRDVRLRHRDGAETSLDLLRYFATGDTEHNPYLQDGDVISVPVYDPDRDVVYVDGAVAYPGLYPHRPGERLDDLLALAGLSSGASTTGEVRLTRAGSGTQLLELAAVQQAPGVAPALQPRDHVFVVPDPTLRGSAAVEGWVRYPGTYPIVPGETTLRELVEMAGGLRDGALLRGVHLERAALPKPKPRLGEEGPRFGIRNSQLTLERPDTLAILQRLRLADLDFLSRSYVVQELRLQNRVSVDMQAALSGAAEPVVLQHGDRLVVPRDEKTVFVFGQVNRPGFVPFVEGRSSSDYIDAAGGRGTFAAEAYVIEAGTGRYLPADRAEVRSGDMIFLDRGVDIADSAELQRLVIQENSARSNARIQTAQVALQLLGTAATLITTYIFVRQQSR